MIQKTTVDWLRFRAQAEPRDILHAMRPMFGDLGEFMTFDFQPRGIMGFKQGAKIVMAGVPVGRMDFGGESQRGWVRVDVPGSGCEWVRDWDAVQEVEALPDAQIRRVDVALTTWDGEIDHDLVVDAHTRGRFVTRGRPPELTRIEKSDERSGRTCYIGAREKSDKFMRCYEKGKELAAKFSGGLPGQVTQINGKAVEDIYRCEVEFKASSKDLPWEIIERRDQFFAGAYPFCADILPGVEGDILARRPERIPQMTLTAALDQVRRQFGSTLFTALHAHQGDMTAVWDLIVGDQHNERLVEAGVLLVDHE
jgi:phage replication initiation protein